jgi:hypothetical protein
MDETNTCDECAEILYRAGDRVPAGLYQVVDGAHQVCLEEEGILPAALDGHATVYVLVHHQWAQIHPPHASAA